MNDNSSCARSCKRIWAVMSIVWCRCGISGTFFHCRDLLIYLLTVHNHNVFWLSCSVYMKHVVFMLMMILSDCRRWVMKCSASDLHVFFIQTALCDHLCTMTLKEIRSSRYAIVIVDFVYVSLCTRCRMLKIWDTDIIKIKIEKINVKQLSYWVQI